GGWPCWCCGCWASRAPRPAVDAPFHAVAGGEPGAACPRPDGRSRLVESEQEPVLPLRQEPVLNIEAGREFADGMPDAPHVVQSIALVDRLHPGRPLGHPHDLA